MQITNPIGSSAAANSAAAGGSSVNGSASSGSPSFQSVLNELNGYAEGSPAQQMQNEILAQLGLTPADLQKMTPAQRQQVEEKIQQMLKAEMQAHEQSAKKGNQINITV
jgi:hypothetical protein